MMYLILLGKVLLQCERKSSEKKSVSSLLSLCHVRVDASYSAQDYSKVPLTLLAKSIDATQKPDVDLRSF